MLVTVLENGRKHRCVELFDLRSPARAGAAPIGKVSVLGEDCRECLGIMVVPRVHEPIHHRCDFLLIRFHFHLSPKSRRQSYEGDDRQAKE